MTTKRGTDMYESEPKLNDQYNPREHAANARAVAQGAADALRERVWGGGGLGGLGAINTSRGPGELPRMIERVNCAVKELHELSAVAGNLGDRIFGQQPEGGNEQGLELTGGSGEVGELENGIDRLNVAINELRGRLNRLARLTGN